MTLGCNIHDDMLGYILVVDTPYFGLSDDNGSVSFDGLPVIIEVPRKLEASARGPDAARGTSGRS